MKKTGIELIAQERKEQIEKHGFDLIRDQVSNSNIEMQKAATSLLLHELDLFPWNKHYYFKLMQKPRIEQLAIAGALIAAEIDRLQALELQD